ncbi:MAG: PQQ-binding-like beta-propeller repeat protein [Gemmataceae bacterium]
MTIPVVCPHCDTRFQLSDELLGKSMRCPNPDCREVFTVAAEVAPPSAPVPPPPAVEPAAPPLPTTIGQVADFVPVLEAEPAYAPAADQPYERVETAAFVPVKAEEFAAPPPAAPARDAAPVAPTVPTAAPIPTATLLPKGKPGIPVAKGGPKEVVWAGDGPVAPPPGLAAEPLPAAALDEEDDGEAFVRTRRKRGRAWPKVVFGLLTVSLLGVFAFIGFGYLRYEAKTEERMAVEAEEAYKDGKYPEAQQKYKDVLTKYPDSRDAEKYKFFASLAELQGAVGAVTTRDNPAPAMKAFDGFVAAHADSTFARPESGYGTDITQVGRKLSDALADHGNDHLKTFRADRKKLDELAVVEKSAEDGKKLIPTADKFRNKQDASLAPQLAKFEELEKSVKWERHRLDVLAPFRGLPQDPNINHDKIEEFRVALQKNELAADPEAQQMQADANAALLRVVGKYGRLGVPAQVPPPDANPPVLISAPVTGSPDPSSLPDESPDRVFAVSRGVLYALDLKTGAVAWGCRVAPPTADPQALDLPARVSVGDGAADWVLVPGLRDGRPVLTARVALTGQPVWEQPLAAPAAGRPTVVGGRVYLPLRDPLGTVLEFDAATGAKTGQVQLRQPVAGGVGVLAGNRPGLNYLFVPADARRVFVFETGREDLDGNKLQPRLSRVLLTEHAKDSLRGEPVLVSPAEETGPRVLVLATTDGPTAMKLRAYPLPPVAELAAADTGPADLPTPRPSETPVPGWAWFPVVTDGERLVLTTDAPAFLAFGVQQLGNADRPLFAVPGPKPASEGDGVFRSQVVAVEEDAYWAVLGGQLVRLRTAADAAGGLRLTLDGAGRPVGEPVHRAQVRGGLGVVVTVTRPAGQMQATGHAQAIGFDLASGQVRWQRRLGGQPAGPVAARVGGVAAIADEDGAVYTVAPTAEAGAGIVAGVAARPFADVDGRAMTAATPDGKSLWVLMPTAGKAGRTLRVRLVVDGALKLDAETPLPDRPAGPPVAAGEAVYLPLANGYLYRLTPADPKLTVGPAWRGADLGDEPVGLVSAVGDDNLLVSDGGRKFLRWNWPAGAGAKPTRAGGPWECREKIVLAPVAVPTKDGVRFAAADTTGAISLFNPDNPAEPAKRWRPGDKSPIPAGAPTDRLAVVTTPAGARLVYAVDRRHLVAIDPAAAEPAWVARDIVPAEAGELAGWWADGGRVLATDQAGRVTVLVAATGAVASTVQPPPGVVALGPAVPFLPAAALMTLADGTATVVPLPPADQAAGR